MKMLTSNSVHRSSLAKEFLHHYLSLSLAKLSKIRIILTCHFQSRLGFVQQRWLDHRYSQ